MNAPIGAARVWAARVQAVLGRAGRALTIVGLCVAGATAGAADGAAPPAPASGAAPATAASAAAARTLPALELFFRHPKVLAAVLSPSGRRLAVTTAQGAARVGLIVVDLDGTMSARRVASYADADVAEVQWINDDQLVFSVVDLAAGSGEDQRQAPGLFTVRADGSGLDTLVLRQGLPFVRMGAPTPREPLPWNHRVLAVPPNRDPAAAQEFLLGELHVFNHEIREITPYWFDVNTRRKRRLNVPTPDGAVQWHFDSTGEPRLVVTYSKGRTGVHWRGPGQDAWKQIDDSDALQPRFVAQFVDDAGQLYVTRTGGPKGLSELTRFDFDKLRPVEPAWVSVDGFDFRGRVIPGGRGEPALGVRVEADAGTTVWLHPRLKALQQRADERLPGRINALDCRRCTADDAVVLVRSASDTDPGSLWLYTAANDRWSIVARQMEGLDPARMARVDMHRIRARDGREIPVWVTVPPGVKPGASAPAVVLVHGGPWVRGGFWRWQPMEQFLASRGYLVISPEFRGSMGYGDAHFRAGWKQYGQAMQDDVADSLLWARQQSLADPARACIAGASYGGYSTLMGLVRHPQLYRCGVAWAAVTDPFLFLEGSWWVRDDVSSEGRRYSLPELVGDVQRDAEMLRAVSPLEQAARIRAPVLLAFGERDLRVPIQHGERLRAAMRKAGNDPQWVSYADEAHGWRKPENQIDFARRVERFLAEHLSPTP